MSDILASSITLEDILAVTQQKRVPVAPELAGYLVLELSDAVAAGGSIAIDPKTVYVSEEGSVAIVKSKTPPPAGEDVEMQLRRVLGELLAISGSQTPALAAVVKRKSGGGVRVLSGELEAALIPVNRAAGRRALARMAREARRISLGLGRAGALPQPEPKKRESQPERQEADARQSIPDPPTLQRPRTPFPDEAATAKRGAPKEDAQRAISVPKLPAAPANRGPAPPPPPARPVVRKAVPGLPGAKAPPLGPAEKLFGGDEVDSLLSTFGVTDGDASDKEMSHGLKELVGLGPTPPPPNAEEVAEIAATTRLDPSTKRHDPDSPTADPPAAAAALAEPEGDGIEDLLAMSDEALPKVAPPMRAPMETPPPLESDEPPRPIAVAAVKSGLATPGRQRAAKAGGTPPESPARTPVAPEAKRDSIKDAAAAAIAARANMPTAPVLPTTKVENPSDPKGVPVKGAPAPAEKPAKAEPKKDKPPGTAMPSGREPRAPRTGFAFVIILLLVLVAGAIGVWKLAPGFFTGRTPENVQKEKVDYEAQKRALEEQAAAQRCKAALVITDAPAASEILMRVGQAPADIERMPMKTRLEFVATAEGFAPKRAIVLAASPWDMTKTPPRLELGIQLEPSKAKAPALDPWPAGEPGADVGGAGDPGTVHIASTPPGAEVWVLTGLGPEARIDQLKCDAGAEVLVAGSQIRKRLRLAPGDAAKAAVDQTGAHVVRLSARERD